MTDVLAAGNALGCAGEWEPFVEILRENENVERLGQVCCNIRLPTVTLSLLRLYVWLSNFNCPMSPSRPTF